MNKQDTIKQWEKNVKDFNESGLGIKEWCKANKIKVHSFYYQRKQLGLTSPKTKSKETINFIKVSNPEPINTKVEAPDTTPLSVVYPSGITVIVNNHSGTILFERINDILNV